MADDDIFYPTTINKDLMIASWLIHEDEDSVCEDVVALFGSNVALINLDVGVAEGGASDEGSNSNSNGASLATIGKRPRSAVWNDYDEVFETINGKTVRSTARCKFCKAELYCLLVLVLVPAICLGITKVYRKKANHASVVKSRLALNPIGSVHN
jgi:hypothetical protein